MPRYIVERDIGTFTQDDLDRIGKRSREVGAKVDDVVWIRSYVSESEGKMYCEYDAPSPEAIREISRMAGLPVDHITEVSLEISPDMFH